MKVLKTDTIPELYIIGAGPGDPDLITIKGYKILQKANVVLYDNLANKELLDIVPDDCEKIYVGKKPYGDYTPQEEIHLLIKEKAFSKGLVVRLKGGDPFIFGRGYEEIMYARRNGINAYYVPGITSMQAAGLDDIPLTHRSLSEGIWIITGTKKSGALSDDLRWATKSNATVVIYMGMKKAQQISDIYIEEGKGEMPVTVIQHASLPHQKSAVGKVKDLTDMIQRSKLTHPAIIIIGEVISLKETEQE